MPIEDRAVTVRGTIKRETESALLLALEDDREVWLPLSQVDRITRRGHYDETDTVVVARWLAKREDLPYE